MGREVLLISQFVTNQICSHVTDLLSFVSLAFLCNPADFLPDYLFHLQCYIWAECFKCFYDTDDVHLWRTTLGSDPNVVLEKSDGNCFFCEKIIYDQHNRKIISVDDLLKDIKECQGQCLGLTIWSTAKKNKAELKDL